MRRPTYQGRAAGGAFAFEAAEACRARELLAQGLGLSRPVVARAFSAGQLRRAAADGAGEPLGPAAPVAAGEVVLLEPRVTRAAGPASDVPARILWEDDFALAAEKPQGLLVHGDGTGAETLTARVQGHLSARAALARPGARPPVAQACQRLDVDTSGVVLFSATEEFQPLFDALVARHGAGEGGIEKRYLALVRGVFPERRATLRDPIGRDRHDARRMRVSAGGQTALTEVELLGVVRPGARGGEACSLLAVTLGTGRRHQIRVHLAAHGFPIVGDALYGAPDRGPFAGRGLMLHAWSEEFSHPVTGERVRVETPWPARFPRA